MDDSGLLALHRLPTGSHWSFAAATSRPSESELRACGFPGSVWASPQEPPPGTVRNLLLLLHGLGDAPRAFAALGRKMALPETAALALRAPLPLPAGLDGTAWHESFDADGGLLGAKPALQSLARDCRGRLLALLELLGAHGWPPHRVFLFGFAQGGVAALDLAVHAPSRLGGVVSVCGHLLGEAPPGAVAAAAAATPVLVLAGGRDEQTPIAEARRRFARLQRALAASRLAELAAMPLRMAGSEREMRPVMEFFAEHLELGFGQLEDDPSVLRLDRVGPDGVLHASAS
jgi:predicted esterase